MWFLLFSLVAYSILATVLLIILGLRIANFNAAPLLDKMPDADGDNPGVRRSERPNWPVSEKERLHERMRKEPFPPTLLAKLNRNPLP